jgi:hypothetical protein
LDIKLMKLLGFLVGESGDASLVTHGMFSIEVALSASPRWACVE